MSNTALSEQDKRLSQAGQQIVQQAKYDYVKAEQDYQSAVARGDQQAARQALATQQAANERANAARQNDGRYSFYADEYGNYIGDKSSTLPSDADLYASLLNEYYGQMKGELNARIGEYEAAMSRNQALIEQAQREAEARLYASKEAQLSALDGSMTKLEQQAYLQKLRNEKNLPAVLASTGVRGGLSESSVLASDAQYQNTLSDIGFTRAQSQRDIQSAIDQAALDLAIRFMEKQVDQNTLAAQTGYDAFLDMLGVQGQEAEAQYRLWRDGISDQQNRQKTDYQRERDAIADGRAEQRQSEANEPDLAAAGMLLLRQGIMPSAGQLAAMGLSEEQARAYIAGIAPQASGKSARASAGTAAARTAASAQVDAPVQAEQLTSAEFKKIAKDNLLSLGYGEIGRDELNEMLSRGQVMVLRSGDGSLRVYNASGYEDIR